MLFLLFVPLPLESQMESTCVRDAVLAATGVRSRGAGAGPRPAQAMYARIAHLGVLHDRLKEFIDPASGLMPQGNSKEKGVPVYNICFTYNWT